MSSETTDLPVSFTEWVTRSGLDQPTVDRLVHKGFKTLQSVGLIRPEDIADMQVWPVAQLRLLEAATDNIKATGQTSAPPPQDSIPRNMDGYQDAPSTSASIVAALLQMEMG